MNENTSLLPGKQTMKLSILEQFLRHRWQQLNDSAMEIALEESKNEIF